MFIRKGDIALPIFKQHVVFAWAAVIANIFAGELADLKTRVCRQALKTEETVYRTRCLCRLKLAFRIGQRIVLSAGDEERTRRNQ